MYYFCPGSSLFPKSKYDTPSTRNFYFLPSNLGMVKIQQLAHGRTSEFMKNTNDAYLALCAWCDIAKLFGDPNMDMLIPSNGSWESQRPLATEFKMLVKEC